MCVFEGFLLCRTVFLGRCWGVVWLFCLKKCLGVCVDFFDSLQACCGRMPPSQASLCISINVSVQSGQPCAAQYTCWCCCAGIHARRVTQHVSGMLCHVYDGRAALGLIALMERQVFYKGSHNMLAGWRGVLTDGPCAPRLPWGLRGGLLGEWTLITGPVWPTVYWRLWWHVQEVVDGLMLWATGCCGCMFCLACQASECFLVASWLQACKEQFLFLVCQAQKLERDTTLKLRAWHCCGFLLVFHFVFGCEATA